MRKFLILLCALGMVSSFSSQAISGGVDNKQNFSSKYIGTFNRTGAVEGADITAYNPAATAWFEEGLYLELDTQLILKNYTVTYDGADHDQDKESIVPTFFAVYKKNNWAAFGSFTVNGGGGTVEYEDGHLVSEVAKNVLGFLAPVPLNVQNEDVMAKSVYYTGTVGAAYSYNASYIIYPTMSWLLPQCRIPYAGCAAISYVVGLCLQRHVCRFSGRNICQSGKGV